MERILAVCLVARMVVDLAVRMVFSRATDWVDPSVVIWAVLLVDAKDDARADQWELWKVDWKAFELDDSLAGLLVDAMADL